MSELAARLAEDTGAIRFSREGFDATFIPDDAIVVRGGLNTPDRFAQGSGVTVDAAGNLQGISANASSTIEGGLTNIRQGQIGFATAGEVRAAGGTVTAAPTRTNATHCLLGGCSADVFSELFTPTIKNPIK